MSRIVRTWWPLAASWLLMAFELPALSAVVARLPNLEVNLAAYSGVVFPLAMIIEAPIIMLLAASTALSKDWASYRIVHKFMMFAGAGLTVLHILVAFTPLYYLVVVRLIGANPETVEAARVGLMIMTPWSWSIAYRRFNQGILIRFGHSKKVGVGTVIRLTSNIIVLSLGYWIGTLPGIVVATSAVAVGVMSEAIYAGLVVRPVIERQLKPAAPVSPPLSWNEFWKFYIPLVITSLLILLGNPLGSAALWRMPEAMSSQAVWLVLSGLSFAFRSFGIAYNEVVIALLDEPHSIGNLRRFCAWLAIGTSIAILLFTVTPLSQFWIGSIMALPSDLANMAQLGLLFILPLPALSAIQSWYQGVLTNGRRTRGITEAVIIYLAVLTLGLGSGITWGRTTGLFVGLSALVVSFALQTAWLWLRSRSVLRIIASRDIPVYSASAVEALAD